MSAWFCPRPTCEQTMRQANRETARQASVANFAILRIVDDEDIFPAVVNVASSGETLLRCSQEGYRLFPFPTGARLAVVVTMYQTRVAVQPSEAVRNPALNQRLMIHFNGNL